MKKTLIVLVAILLYCGTPAAQELPPDILADQYLLAATAALQQQDRQAAINAFQKIEALNVTPPTEFFYFYGKVLVEDGVATENVPSIEKGQALLKKYVVASGREAEHYQRALEVLNTAEGTVEAVKTEKCWTTLTLLCVARLTLDATMSEKDRGSALFIIARKLITVATAQIKAGAAEDAREPLKIATDIAVSEGHDSLFKGISEAQMAMGQFSVASKTAGLIDNDFSQRLTLSNIVTAQAEAGQFSGAIKTAEMMEDVGSRVSALLDVATAQREAGKIEEARILIDKGLALAASIDDAGGRASALSQVSTAQAEAGQFGGAIETAMSIDDAQERTRTLVNVAARQTKAGNVEDARTTIKRAADAARSVRDLYTRARVLSDIAVAYVEVGERESARTTIDIATAAVADRQAYYQALTLTTTATVQTKAGNIRAARENIRQATAAAKSIQDSSHRTERLRAIVDVGIEAAQFIEAAQAAALPIDPDERARALIDVALAQANAGKVEAARVTIEMADDSAKLIKEPFERAYARALIANVRTTTGDITDRTPTDIVAEAAQSLQDAYDRTRLCAAVALAQIEAGHLDGAQETINLVDDPATQIEDSIKRAHALTLVARAHAKAGHFAEAAATARLIKAVRGQVQALAAIALAQAEAGAVEDARATISMVAETAKANGLDVQVLTTVATVQAKAGMAGAAQATIRDALQDIESRSYRDPGRWLVEVALAQVAAGQSEDALATIDRAVTAMQSGGDSSWAWAITDIARAQTKAGQSEAALRTLAAAVEAAKSMESMSTRLSWFFDIARAQEKAGSAEEARGTIDTAIKDFKSAKKDWQLLSVIEFVSSVGFAGVPLGADQLAEIIAIIKSAEFKNAARIDYLPLLASFLARQEGTFENVMEVLRRIDTPTQRAGRSLCRSRLGTGGGREDRRCPNDHYSGNRNCRVEWRECQRPSPS